MATLDSLDLAAVSADLRRELGPDERLLWSGRPRQGVIFRSSDWFMIPFSIFWFGVSVLFIGTALWNGTAFMALFGIPFVFVGLYITVGRFVLEARARVRTSYGVTNQRVIIKSGLVGRTTNSIALRTLSDLSLVESASGGGIVYLGRRNPATELWGGMNWPGVDAPVPRLELSTDARKVFDLILSQQRAA